MVGHRAQSRRAERREVDGHRGGDQRLVGADVAGRLLAPNVLLAGLQGKDEPPPALPVVRHTGKAAGHLPHVAHGGGQQADVGAAVEQRNAERLPLGGGDVRAQLTGWTQHRHGDRIGGHDTQRARRVGKLAEFGHRFDDAQEIGILHQHGRGIVVQRTGNRPRFGASGGAVEGDGGNAQADPGQVGCQHLPILRMDRLADRDGAAPAAQPRGHQRRFGKCRGAVIHRRVGHLHAEQPGDHGLELEDGLQRALAHLRLVGGVGGVQFATEQQMGNQRRRVVVVGAGAEEAAMVVRGPVAQRQVAKQRRDLLLGQPVRQVEAREALRAGHVGE